MCKQQKMIALTGPTASGKTALALRLAQVLSGEIISCDSMQIYQEMDIGTAKATPSERLIAPHHLIDILSPSEPFSAADYAVRAEAAALDILSRGKLPILTGGTGLYLEALRSARHASDARSDPAFREEMRLFAEREGNDALHALLCAVDPESAEAIHKNNVTRVIRALEIHHATGKPKSVVDREASTENPRLKILNITLTFHSRELLYERIDRRVDAMMEEGLLEETRRLYEKGYLEKGMTASAAIGYKECLGAVRGEESPDEARAALKLATRHYAKRQITWFSAREHIPLYADEDGKMKDTEVLLSEALALVRAFLNEEDQ